MASKILLIDDDKDDRELFCEAIEEVNNEIICHTSTNCRTAIEKLNSKEIEVPDIIFLDINMPGISGWQCLVLLKENDAYKHIPVVMYSTTGHAIDIEKAHELGAFCFFLKPSDFKDLKESLSVLANHLFSNSLSSLTSNSKVFVVPGRE